MLSPSIQVFLDSPMAISATEIFRRHPECYDEQTMALFRDGRDPFGLPGLHFTRETAESMALNRITGGAIIMAGSGMCTGGRVRHHLKHNLWRRDASVVFVGFAAKGTLARQIIDGAKEVQHFRRADSGQSPHPHDQRLLRPRRPGRAPRLAQADSRKPNIPRPRRGRGHARLCGSARRNAGRNALRRSDLCVVS